VFGLLRLQDSHLERNPSGQPVQIRMSQKGDFEISPNAHRFVESYNYLGFEHFVRPGLCPGEGSEMAQRNITA
jgi:hypothetical protein